MEITFNTPLLDIGWDNAGDISDDLIDTSIVGDDWGRAWIRIAAKGGTVADLNHELVTAILPL